MCIRDRTGVGFWRQFFTPVAKFLAPETDASFLAPVSGACVRGITVEFFCHTELTCLVCIAFLVVCAVQLLLLTCCSKIHVAARVM